MIPFSTQGLERRASEWTAVLAALVIVFAIAIAEVTLQSTPLFETLRSATNGHVTIALIANVCRLVAVVAILFGAGPFRLRDAGVRIERIVPGIGIVLAIWALTQIGLATNDLVRDGMLRLHGAWRISSVGTIVAWVREVGGSALFEELFWRGFLLAWLTAELTRRFRHPLPGAFFGMAISQALYALAHVPERLDVGIPWGQMPIDVVLLTLTGIYYGFLYLRTDNLFVPIGVHALANWPAPLFDSTANAAKMTILVASAFLFVPRIGGLDTDRPEQNLRDEGDEPIPPNPSPS